MAGGEWSAAGLWLAVASSGIYHGINPGMGWPLAVSAGLMGHGRTDLLKSLGPIAAGHTAAMTGILLPFGVMSALVDWQSQIQIAAALILITAGVYLLVNRRHPRFLARIRPTQLALWSFAVAVAHGAGLMLVPIYLGLCRAEELDAGHAAALTLMGGNLAMAVLVSLAHAAAMVVSGGIMALIVHDWLGPAFIARSWFNLEAVWATSLILIGVIALVVS